MRAHALRLIRLAALCLALFGPVAVLVLPGLAVAQADDPLNYAAWEQDAARAEKALTEGKASSAALDQVRGQIVEWRDRFVAAQSVNADRIKTLQQQIATLGPAPAEGETEAAEIAERRTALNAQLAEAQAPVLRAAEARNRADGIIREIDTTIRARQADALLKLSPTPLNPLHWPAGLAVLTQGARTIWTETSEAWANPARRTDLRNNLPAIVLYLALAVGLVWKGPGLVARVAARLQGSRLLRGRRIAAAVLSLGQIVVPLLGTYLLVSAVISTGMTGLRTSALLSALPVAAAVYFLARWIGTWLFDRQSDADADPLALTDRPGEALLLAKTLGIISAFEVLRIAFTTEVRPPLSQAAQAVWLAPNVVIVSIFLFRLGMLLRRNLRRLDQGGEAVKFRNRLLGLLGTATAGVALLAPVLALIGYVAAANALIWPTVVSMGLIGLLILAQRFSTDIYMAFAREDESNRDALIPVLAGFFLTLAALPLFALIWGARTSDLYEIWTTFREGVSFGSTRISPTSFLLFVAVFAFGYLATRLLQGALRSSVLPRTQLDRGAQNAIAAGVGYVGVFLAALIAINAAGLDLSGLAIVAGALSVGIGFGLQNIVSNFVSGIILLIERPISEGDTIEVGGKQGIVKNISVRSTRIETPDRTYLIVPNADLVSGVVTNMSRFSATGRLVMPVAVAMGSDTRKVHALLTDICDDQPAVMIDPPPSVGFVGFAGGALNFEIRVILSDTNLKGDVQTEINHQIRERFAAEGIEFPQPQRDIFVRNAEAFGRALAPDAQPARPQRPARRRTTVDPDRISNDPNEGEDPDRI